MPFGLTNVPASFQNFINDCVLDYLDMFCTTCLDDILIYSDTLEYHQVHVEKVLEALQRNGVLLKLEKFEFHTQRSTYLGLIIEPNGVKINPRKVETVKNWTVPKTVKDVQAFLGFANFYRRFTRGFSELADYVSASVLSQSNDNGILQPVAYFSKKHSPAKCNYEIYDKELLVIIRSFEDW
ncbi:uncharacterized protein H6S33_004919 [Morchella sextelata]|uniref:uncharacterized protein n=1 Tax=Morchella sextelata TaxID=1174677 RepID=UPI001D049FC4|nr:uncharacterized protein H6S33_004919 [Morchella sextelata]KAH0604937.1 hypothetical protein H6S33_004919 [Morchella sextelata]